MEAGGYASKLGDRYEDFWAVYQTLQLLAGGLCTIEREPVGPEGLGVDLWVTDQNGSRICQQCKRENRQKNAWSMSDLAGRGILEHIRCQLEREPTARFIFVSAIPAQELQDLCRSATDSRDPQSFYEHQVGASKNRQRAFETFCRGVKLSSETSNELKRAHSLLQRSDFYLFQDATEERRRLRWQAGGLVDGDPNHVLAELESWVRQQLRKRITATDVAGFLEQRGYRLRKHAEPSNIFPSVERLRTRFAESLKHHLAGGVLIPRPETDEIIEAIGEANTRLIIVHGVAGVGKSGVLYELSEQLRASGVPYLPLRLDRQVPAKDTSHFGEELGLPNSPARCVEQLSSGKRAVLILDQVDALRWTSAHSSDAWDVCRELIGEVLESPSDLRVIACCRTFDLEHDPRIRGWERENRNLHKIKIAELADETVATLVHKVSESDGGTTPQLRSRERRLLRHVLHLKMWADIFESTGDSPVFDSAWQLMSAFWSSRFDDLADHGLGRDRVGQILRVLIEKLKDGAKLGMPVAALGLSLSRKETEILQSLHILQVDPAEARVSFCHQSYLDYLVAERLLSRIDIGERSVRSWLGERAEQSLFRREQLRLVLSALREQERCEYVLVLRDLLDAGDDIRFHLKLLVLQFLGQIQRPEPGEVELIMELLLDEALRPHILAETLPRSLPWFEILDERGDLSAWLADGDTSLRDAAESLLQHVAETAGDRVAQILQPFEGESEEWARRCLWILPSNPERDSNGLFSLRLRLVKRGVDHSDLVNWSGLAAADPLRFADLLVALLMARAVEVAEYRVSNRYLNRESWHWYRLESVDPKSFDDASLLRAWCLLPRALSLLFDVNRQDADVPRVLETYTVEVELLEPVIGLVRKLGEELLRRNWKQFAAAISQSEVSSLTTQLLALDALAMGPDDGDLADWALLWLLVEPERLSLRYKRHHNPWQISWKVVERYAPLCSGKCFRILESFLLMFQESDLLEHYRFRHKKLGQNPGILDLPSKSGATAYHLLAKLPPIRRSREAERRLLELGRKFDGIPAVYFAGFSKGGAGYLGSPISQLETMTQLSDESWLRIIDNEKIRRSPAPWRRRGSGFIEATVETLSADLRAITGREPERFARIALRIPENTPSEFLSAILSGLGYSRNPPQDLSDEQKKQWRSPSHEALEDVLSLPAVRKLVDSHDVSDGSAFCAVLRNHSEYPWSSEVLGMLVKIAQNHADPRPGEYSASSNHDRHGSSQSLETNALNSTRGAAGYAIRSILFASHDRFAELQPAIKSLIQDVHPSVRVAGIAACLPILNIDRQRAIRWFLEACRGPDEILGTSEVDRFLKNTVRPNFDELCGLVERMVASEVTEVVRSGARCVAACHLMDGKLSEKYEECLNGSPAHRLGLAEVGRALVGEAEYAEKAKGLLSRLAQDEDEEVQRFIAGLFQRRDMDLFKPNDPFLATFARSKAFQAEPTWLLQALEKHAGSLLPFAECLLRVGTTFAEDLAETSRDYSSRIQNDVRLYLIPLLLRLYEQSKGAHEELHQECLDLWDHLLERRVGQATELVREIDRS